MSTPANATRGVFYYKSNQLSIAMSIQARLFKRTRMSDICADIAQAFFAAMVIEQFLEENPSIFFIATGLLLAVGFWTVSLQLAKQ